MNSDEAKDLKEFINAIEKELKDHKYDETKDKDDKDKDKDDKKDDANKEKNSKKKENDEKRIRTL